VTSVEKQQETGNRKQEMGCQASGRARAASGTDLEAAVRKPPWLTPGGGAVENDAMQGRCLAAGAGLCLGVLVLAAGCTFDSGAVGGLDGGPVWLPDGAGERAPLDVGAADRGLDARGPEGGGGDAAAGDGPGEGGAPDAGPDGAVCTGPRCDGTDLITCGPSGEVPVPCPHGCNAGRLACNECDPGSATCAGDSLVTCTSDGLIEAVAPCDYGCDSGRAACNQCQPGVTACVADHVVACGNDGTIQHDTPCPDLGCAGASPPRCWSLSPSNGLGDRLSAGTDNRTFDEPDPGRMIVAHTDTGAMEDCRRDGSACQSLDPPPFAVVSQSGGPSIGVWSTENLTVRAQTLVVFVGANAAAFTATGTIELAGVLSAAARQSSPGPGGGGGGGAESAGGGTAAGARGASGDTGIGGTQDDSGGGGGGFGGLGGLGGMGGDLAGGAGGQPAYGSPELCPLLGGSGGGGGGDNDGGRGGGGGGGLQLVAGSAIHIGAGAAVLATGGGGQGGQKSGCSDNGAGGGGGSGGGILLEAPRVVIDAGGAVSANGGGGGAGSVAERSWPWEDCTAGPNGADGWLGATPASGGAGSGDGGGGGAGGAGSQLDGTAGAEDTNGGGGGGAVGRIRVNTRSLGDDLGAGSVSPALGTTAATHGTVALR
jgi:hypothetical protein